MEELNQRNYLKFANSSTITEGTRSLQNCFSTSFFLSKKTSDNHLEMAKVREPKPYDT